MIWIISHFVQRHYRRFKQRNLFTKRQLDIFSAAVLIMLSYAISALLGIVRERLLAANYLLCCAAQLDAYKVAFRVPDLLFQLTVPGILGAAFIPLYAEKLSKDSGLANKVASAMINGLLLFYLGLAGLYFLSANYVIQGLTGNFSLQQVNLAAQISRWLLLSQLFFVISQFFSNLLQSHHRFLVPAMAPVVYNLSIIVSLWLGADSLGIFAPVVGVVSGAGLHMLIQLPLIRQIEFDYQPVLHAGLGLWKKVFRISLPRVMAVAANQVEPMISIYFATSLSVGSLFLFSLAQQLKQLPVQLMGGSISQAAFPSLSQFAYHNPARFKRVLRDNLLQILYLVLPLTAVMLILRIPIVRLAFGSKFFPWQATKQTAWAVAAFSLAIPAWAGIQLLLRAYFAVKDTFMPLIVSLASMGLFAFLAWFFTRQTDWGIIGLGLSSAIAGNFQFLAMAYFLNWRVSYVDSKLLVQFFRLLLASAVTVVSLWLPFQFLDKLVFDTTRVVPLIALSVTTTAIGLSIYILLNHLLGSQAQLLTWKLLVNFPGFKRLISKAQFWLGSWWPELTSLE